VTFPEFALATAHQREGRPCPLPDDKRIGDWGVTFTGRKFWPQDPQVGDVDIRDIAHHLSLQCRFAGACRGMYSVAQHSVLVSRLCTPPNQLVGLLHDASEAYLQDIIRPLKRALAGYKTLENLWSLTIGLDLGLGEKLLHLPDEVHAADREVLIAERRDLMHPTAAWKTGPSDHAPIDPWAPERAEREFLLAYHSYAEAQS